MEFIKKWGLCILLGINVIGCAGIGYLLIQIWINSVALSTKVDILDKTYPEIRVIYQNMVDTRNILLVIGIILFISSAIALGIVYNKSRKQIQEPLS